MLDIPIRRSQDVADRTDPMMVQVEGILSAVSDRLLGDWLRRRLAQIGSRSEQEAVQHSVVLVRNILEDSARLAASVDPLSLGTRSDEELGRILELATHLSAQLIREATDATLAQRSDRGALRTRDEQRTLPLELTVTVLRRLRPVIKDTLAILKARRMQAEILNRNH